MKDFPDKSFIEKLVDRSQKGDEKSFEYLFDLFFEKILQYVSFRVEKDEAEDIVSDIFLKVVEKLNTYTPNPKSSFNAWIFRIAHNTVIDFYRTQKEIYGLSDQEQETYFLQIPDKNPTPDEALQSSFDRKRIHKALKNLPSAHREIIELKYLEEFSNREISEITGKSEGNIRVIQLRALREVRKYLEGE